MIDPAEKLQVAVGQPIDRVRPDAKRAQMDRHPIGLVVEFPIADFPLGINQSNSIGCAFHLRLKEFVNTFFSRKVGCRPVPFSQPLAPLRFGRQRQIRHALGEVSGCSLQQQLKMTEHTGDGCVLEATWFVTDLKRHFRAARNVHPEREAWLIANRKLAPGPFAAQRPQGGVPRRVLEIKNAFEQPLSDRQATPALHFK